MSEFAVIGHPIGHTMSPYIHSMLFAVHGKSDDYTALDIAPGELNEKLRGELCKLGGFNVTIPHKQSIIPMLDELDDTAELYGAVNCVKCGKVLRGCNTDAYGFRAALKARSISLKGSVLILGSGGAAHALALESALAGCSVTIAARSESGARLAAEIERQAACKVRVITFAEVRGGYDLVVNATPVGMFPNVNASPLEYEQLADCSALFDAVYNPRETLLMKYAKRRNMTVAEGMAMLVWQAARSHEIWYGARFSDSDIDRIIDSAYLEMERKFSSSPTGNIVLCGFMGCGKSTVGKLLARKLGRQFIDMDRFIEQREGMSVSEIFDKYGECGFRDAEHAACEELAKSKGTVIAAGGGALTFERNVNVFGKDTVIYLQAEFDTIFRRIGGCNNRPLFRDPEAARELYNKRTPMYESAADITVCSDREADETANQIVNKLCKKG